MYKKNWQINIELINELKNNSVFFLSFIKGKSDNYIISILEKLWKINNDILKEPLKQLSNNKNEKIRFLAIKNLAKIKNNNLTDFFINCIEKDNSSIVKREAVSAIWRMRDYKNIEVLSKLLKDKDPEIIMQAIRGILSSWKKEEIKDLLKPLINHPNEIIQDFIKKELYEKEKSNLKYQKHDEFSLFLKNNIIHWDVLDIIKYIPDESIHLTFTSPPYYNARDYSIYQSYDEYLTFLEKVFKETHRITKEGRFLIVNTSPIIIPRISRAHASKRYPIPYDLHPLLVKMWWEFIDDIVWVKPEASVKNRNASFLQHRKPLAYKPNAISESVMVYRKKTDKLIDWNIKQYSQEKIKKSKVTEKYETSNIWKIKPAFDKIHSAVFPIELCDKIIKYYSFVDDLVFDPFAWSWTLWFSAINLNRSFILTEKEFKYIESIKDKVNKNTSSLKAKINFIDLNDFKKIVWH